MQSPCLVNRPFNHRQSARDIGLTRTVKWKTGQVSKIPVSRPQIRAPTLSRPTVPLDELCFPTSTIPSSMQWKQPETHLPFATVFFTGSIDRSSPLRASPFFPGDSSVVNLTALLSGRLETINPKLNLYSKLQPVILERTFPSPKFDAFLNLPPYLSRSSLPFAAWKAQKSIS